MDIYSAEKYVANLLEFVQDKSKSEVKMYSKSRERWKSIANTCIKVVNVITEMLQDEVMEQDYTIEVSEDTYDPGSLEGMVLKMQAQLSALSTFVGCKPDAKVVSNDPLSPDKRREIIKQYLTTLEEVANNQINVKEINKLTYILYNWFRVRFVDSTKCNNNFRYNIRRFPEWLSGIIIMYSYHVYAGDVDEFVSDFNLWLDSCYNSSKSGCYPIPLEVYKFVTKHSPEYVQTISMVVYDILIDLGLSDLVKDEECYLNDDHIYRICKDINPECLDSYVHYTSNPDVIESVGMHMLEGGNATC